MELIKHSIEEADPPFNETLLLLVDTGAEHYYWTTGFWNQGWHCSFDNAAYRVIEWYELPKLAVESYQVSVFS